MSQTYFFTKIDNPQTQSYTYVVTETPKEGAEIISKHKTKQLAVNAMVYHCDDNDFMQIENTKFYHQELVDLLEKWDQ